MLDKPMVNRVAADSGLWVRCLLSLKNKFHRQQEAEFRNEIIELWSELRERESRASV